MCAGPRKKKLMRIRGRDEDRLPRTSQLRIHHPEEFVGGAGGWKVDPAPLVIGVYTYEGLELGINGKVWPLTR